MNTTPSQENVTALELRDLMKRCGFHLQSVGTMAFFVWGDFGAIGPFPSLEAVHGYLSGHVKIALSRLATKGF